MSKIICDVCGTSYPENVSHCPICGCVRPGDAQSVASDNVENNGAGAEGYQYAKGGHFSKSNVRKRNRANQQVAKEEPPVEEESQYEESRGGKGLAIVAVILLLAIIAVVIFIALRFFLPGFGDLDGDKPTTSTTAPITNPDDITTGPVTIPCEGIELTADEVQLTQSGMEYTISVKTNPANTTDTIRFESSNSDVATVTPQGLVQAVAEGEAIITITCGDESIEFKVICSFIPDVTEPPVTEPPVTEPSVKLELNRKDFSLFYKGASWNVYDGDIPVSEIKWTSDNESIATITNGKVVAVGPGSIQVHAEYQGQKVSCWVRCSFQADDDTNLPGTGGVTEEGKYKQPYSFVNNYGLDWRDSTIKIGDSFSIYLYDAEKTPIPMNWKSTDESVCTVSGNRITGVSAGTAYVQAEFEGVTYSWRVRVTTE